MAIACRVGHHERPVPPIVARLTPMDVGDRSRIPHSACAGHVVRQLLYSPDKWTIKPLDGYEDELADLVERAEGWRKRGEPYPDPFKVMHDSAMSARKRGEEVTTMTKKTATKDKPKAAKRKAPAGKPPAAATNSATAPRIRAASTASPFVPGAKMSGTYKGATFAGEVTEEGFTLTKGKGKGTSKGATFKSANAAAMAIHGHAINARRFWTVEAAA